MLEPGEGQDRPRDFQDRERGGEDREQWKPDVWVRDGEPARERAAARGPRRPQEAGDGRPRPPGARRSANESRSTGGNDRYGTRRPDDRRPADAAGRPTVERKGGAPTAGATAAARAERRLAEAAKAYEADRYADVRRLLKPLLASGAPSPEVRELHGLTLYRMGRWADAIAELKAFSSATGSYDQHPVLADCHRALKRWGMVEELWEEIRQASPGPEVVAEGRIVAAGAMSDRGDLSGALNLLERAPSNVKRPALHHLRLWYAQADLYERAGEIPRARELFRTILRHDPGFVDTAERLAVLD